MIVVDSSVWIDFFNGRPTEQVERLRALLGRQPLLIGDIILCEILQGLQTERDARRVEAALRCFDVAQMLNPDLAILAAANYRRLRTLGYTIRKTIDLIIGTFCIENGHHLLHADRDFQPMCDHLGLRTI